VIEEFDLEYFGNTHGLGFGLIKAPFPFWDIDPRPFFTNQLSSLFRASTFADRRSSLLVELSERRLGDIDESIDVIKKFYKRAIPRQTAEKFWKIRPVSDGKIVAFG
jgi:hypothetical protein